MATFEDLRKQCLSEGRLFEDKDFKANAQSIYPGENNPEDWLWKRTKVWTYSNSMDVVCIIKFALGNHMMGTERGCEENNAFFHAFIFHLNVLLHIRPYGSY